MRNNTTEETARVVMRSIKKNERGHQAGLFRFKFLPNVPFPVTTDVLMRVGGGDLQIRTIEPYEINMERYGKCLVVGG